MWLLLFGWYIFVYYYRFIAFRFSSHLPSYIFTNYCIYLYIIMVFSVLMECYVLHFIDSSRIEHIFLIQSTNLHRSNFNTCGLTVLLCEIHSCINLYQCQCTIVYMDIMEADQSENLFWFPFFSISFI